MITLEKIVKELRNKHDSDMDAQWIDAEITDKCTTVFISGLINRMFTEAVGGTYLEDKEVVYTCVAEELHIESITTFNAQGEQISTTFTPEEIERAYNWRT